MVNYKIGCDLAEETGIHVGDGSINIYNGNFCYTVACHKEDDKNYVDNYILPLIKRIYHKSPKARIWSKGTYGFRNPKNLKRLDLLHIKYKLL